MTASSQGTQTPGNEPLLSELLPSRIKITASLYRGKRTEIYQALGPDDLPLIIKRLNPGEQSVANLQQLRQEFEFLSELQGLPVRPALGIVELDGLAALVLSDIQGLTLQEYYRSHQLSIPRTIQLFILWTRAVAQLHVRGIIHRDINPQNTLITHDGNRLYLIDFGISTRLSRSQTSLPPSEAIEGTLPYIAPEQTGRTGHPLDERCDLYALGASFYELLTGAPPFAGKDGIELIHAHLAQRPISPHERNPEVPVDLSRLILKLLEKNPTDRYRGAIGVIRDLEQIAARGQNAAGSASFTLAEKDWPLRLAIPSRIYGREEEQALLLKEWQHVISGGNALVLIGGASGIGKTALIKELTRHGIRNQAFVAKGKHEELGRDRPYDAIIQASRSLLAGMHAADDDVRYSWSQDLAAALGANAALLTDMIPEMSEILGAQPAPTHVAPKEAQNRLTETFIKFFRSFAQKDRPLVLFFDDLQWSDSASLDLIADLASDTSHGHILLIGAFRPDEVDVKHPLHLLLQQWPTRIAHYLRLDLGGISTAAITSLCCDTLHWTEAEAAPLAQVLAQRTQGNAFFVNQMLQGYYREGLLFFALDRGSWQADWQQIRNNPGSEHVINLLTKRLRDLPVNVQRVLGCAAFYGHSFQLSTIASALNEPLQVVAEAASMAASEQLIIPDEGGGYHFLHDRVIEACQAVIDAAEVLPLRLTLARVLVANRKTLKGLTPSEAATALHALNHFKAARDLVTSSVERETLARLYCDAGDRAQAATAWRIGADLYHQGSAFLPPHSDRALQRELSYGEGSCAMLDGATSRAEQCFASLLREAKTPLEIAEVQYFRCRLYVALNLYAQAVSIGIDGLKALKVRMGSPRAPLARCVIASILCLRRVQKKPMAELLALPTMTVPEHILTMKLFTETVHPAMLAHSNGAIMLVCAQIDFVLEHGHSTYSAFPFLYLAVVINAISMQLPIKFWRNTNVRKLLDLYVQLNDQRSDETMRLRGEFIYQTFAAHAMPDYRDTLFNFFPLTVKFMDRGDALFSGYAAISALDQAFMTGRNLVSVTNTAHLWREYVQRYTDDPTKRSFDFYRFNFGNLSDADLPTAIEFIKDPGKRQVVIDKNQYNYPAILSSSGATLALCGDFESGFERLHQALKLNLDRTFPGHFIIPFYYMFYTLSLSYVHAKAKPLKRLWLRLLMLRKLWQIKLYAQIAPAYCNHKVLFMKALSKVMDKAPLTEIITQLQEALQTAHKERFASDEAIISEYLGRLLITNKLEYLAAYPLLSARSAYERWGLSSKVRQLDELCQPFKFHTTGQAPSIQTLNRSVETLSQRHGLTMDNPTLLRAAYAMSREIHLPDLKKTLLHLLVENAGARHAAVIWRAKDSHPINQPMQVVAYCTSDGTTVVEASASTDEIVSLRALSYVKRTRDTLILGDAASESPWQDEASLKSRHVKSLLCMPIMAGGSFRGAIYLENDLLAHAFTPDRVQVLSVLAGQMASSLDNAALYSQLSSSLAAEQAARAQEKAAHRAFIVAEEARRHLQTGLEAAEAVQKSLVTVQSASESYDIAYLYDPAENTGGDWLSTFYDEQHNWLYLFLGDVTGHGISSALVTAAAAGAAASFVESIKGQPNMTLSGALNSIAAAANTAVLGIGGVTGRLMTMTMIGIDLQTGQGCYVNAGHPAILWMGKTVKTMLAGGAPLGFRADSDFGHREFNLNPGDLMVLYSDGLIENRNAKGQHLSLRSIRKICQVSTTPADVIAELKNQVSAFERTPLMDDSACIAFKWLGPVHSLKSAG